MGKKNYGKSVKTRLLNLLFTDSFATDETRKNRWKAFLKKIQWKESLDFETVMEVIKARLQPMAEKYWEKKYATDSAR